MTRVSTNDGRVGGSMRSNRMSQPTSTVGTAVTGTIHENDVAGPVYAIWMCASTRWAPVAGSVSSTNSTFSAACAIGSEPSGGGALQKNPPHARASRAPTAAIASAPTT